MSTLERSGVFRQMLSAGADAPVECRWVFDIQDEKFIYISPSIHQMTGYSVEEALRHKLWDCMPAETIRQVSTHNFPRIVKFLQGDHSEDIVSATEHLDFYCKDGTIKSTCTRTRLVQDPRSGHLYLCAVSREKLPEIPPCPLTTDHQKLVRVLCFEHFALFAPSSTAPVKWRTKKAEELAAFLFHNQQTHVEKWKLCEALWPDSAPETVRNSLHMTIYWLKKALRDVGIPMELRYQNGCYNISVPHVYSDVHIMDQIIARSLDAESPFSPDLIRAYEQAVQLYEHDYLSLNGYPWASSKSEHYRQHFLRICKNLVRFYLSQHNHAAAMNVLQKVLCVDSFCEDAHERLLELYLLEKRHTHFIQHYNKLKTLFDKELGITPRASIERLYHSLQLTGCS